MIKNGVMAVLVLCLMFGTLKFLVWGLAIVIVLTAVVKCVTAPPNLGKTRSGGGSQN